MRSRKLELEDVVRQFEAWRAKPHGRLIPEELWKAALGLLDRYAPSTICRHLRMSPARFKQVREARDMVVAEERRMRRGRSDFGQRAGRTGRHRSAVPGRMMALGPSRNGFVEFPPLGVGLGGGTTAPTLRDVEGGPAGCRLTLESALGTFTLVTAKAEGGLVDAFCRFVLSALVDGFRA